MGKNGHIAQPILSMGVMMISTPISTPTQQNYHHDHIFTYTFDDSLHFLHGKPLPCGMKTTMPEKNSHWTQKRTHGPCECHKTYNDHTMTKDWFQVPHPKLHSSCSQLLKYVRIKAWCFNRTHIC